jgi:hypothetical protein
VFVSSVHIQGTFSALSGNVQSKFRKRLVYIQGTFSVHSGTFSVHSGNVQCIFRLSIKRTKVDAEYNLPTWVPTTRVNINRRSIPGVDLRVHHVLPRVPQCLGPVIQGTLSAHSGNVE